MAQGKSGADILLLAEDPANPGTYLEAAKQTDLTRDKSANMIETTSKQDDHTDYIYGKKDDTVSLDALFVPNDAGQQALKDAIDNEDRIKIRRSEDGTEVEEADALVENVSETFSDNSASEFSADFQLTSTFTSV